MINKIEFLKTMMQISGVIGSIMALFFSRFLTMSPDELKRLGPSEGIHQWLSVSSLVVFFSTFCIITGFGGLWFSSYYYLFHILLLLSGGAFLSSVFLISFLFFALYLSFHYEQFPYS